MIQNGSIWCRSFLLALLFLSVCVRSQDRQQSRQVDFYSSEKESALGAALAAQMRHQTTPLGLANVDRYVRDIGGRLAVQMPNAPEHWTFSVIQDQRGGSTYEPVSW
jgi:predicted Zn-dependent protease